MKLAYFGSPHIGGTFMVYRQLRAGLAPWGVDLRWLGVGEARHAAIAEGRWPEEMAHGGFVRPQGNDADTARSLLETIERERFEGVFVNVLADSVQTGAVPHLPERLLRFMIVHNITPATYAAARSVRDHVHATIGVSERIRDDLVAHHGFPPARTSSIANASEFLPGMPRAGNGEGARRILFVGRVEDQSKGVFWLPRILECLPAAATLTVCGSGPDLPELIRRCARFGPRVSFVGALQPAEVAGLLDSHDALIAPSRFEGFLIVLAEAMMKGCVPVVSRISGVTDRIVDDGESGFVFRVGDVKAAARALMRLFDDPGLLGRMSAAAVDRAAKRFNVDLMGFRYFSLISEVRANPPDLPPQASLERWQVRAGSQTSLRTRLPLPVKNFARTIRERWA